MGEKIIWKPIPEWNGLYEVSSNGRVRSCPKTRRFGRFADRYYPRAVLKHSIDQDGYHKVVLADSKTNRRKTTSVHRLMAFAFLGDPPTGADMVAHNDGNPSNNTLSNIRWATAKENTDDRRIHGRQLYGEKVKSAKLTVELVKMIRNSDKLARIISKELGVSIALIYHVRNRRAWAWVQ